MWHSADKQAGAGSSAPQHCQQAEDVGEETTVYIKETKSLWEMVQEAYVAIPSNIVTILSTHVTKKSGMQSHLHSCPNPKKGGYCKSDFNCNVCGCCYCVSATGKFLPWTDINNPIYQHKPCVIPSTSEYVMCHSIMPFQTKDIRCWQSLQLSALFSQWPQFLYITFAHITVHTWRWLRIH